MNRQAIREMVITKVTEELYVDRSLVIQVLEEVERESGDKDDVYDSDTIAKVVARILDRMDDEDW